ncbi:RING-H2 finger protein ATL66-like [Musa acuminata AAA Group]|uniref:RING-H2 finger protein ATL66-like n=1 Tax=Musa acuminata AAA Group TaxID=214697 RepID=UPI0031D57006
MAAQEAQPFHWKYDELDDKNYRVHGHNSFLLLHPLMHHPPLPISDIFSVHLHRASGTGEEAQCPICLSNLRDGDKVKVLPSCVDMGFVCACVDAWSRAHTSCPPCRAGWLWLEGKNN